MTDKKSVGTAVETTELGGGSIDQPTVRQALVKALVIAGRFGDEETAQASMNAQDDEWQGVGAVNPILDPESLMSLYEISDSLRQNIDAYATNIEGNGHVLFPKIDLTKDDAFDKVKNAMDAANYADAVDAAISELRIKSEDDGDDVTDAQLQEVVDGVDPKEPTDSEVRSEMEKLQRQMQREMHVATAWFRNVHPELSFIDLREMKRIDEETIGHGCWEVRRDSNGLVRRLDPIAGYTILPLQNYGDEVEVERQEWVSEIATRNVIEPVRFMRYVQRIDGNTIYFKDFQDPRLVSNNSGKIYMKKTTIDGVMVMKPDPAKMKRDEPTAKPAGELVYFAIYSPKTEAGMIRWGGQITGVIGSRAAAEANLAYFENHAVPDAALLISGGQLNNESVQRIQESLRSKTQGPRNAHRTLVIQATAKGSLPNQVTNNPDMEWKNLSDFQQGDALFQGYTENNKTGLSSCFRQALLLIGHIPSDLNRATAIAILGLVEKQVYGPLRAKFDWWVNNTLLPAIGIKLLKFESLSPEATNIDEMAKAIEPGIKGGAFTPNMLLELYSVWLNREFPQIEAEWGDVPFTATLAQLNLEAEPPADVDPGDTKPTSEPTEESEIKGEGVGVESRLRYLEKQLATFLKQKTDDAEFISGFGKRT